VGQVSFTLRTVLGGLRSVVPWIVLGV
jgi:hypothetical protein